MNNQDLIDFVTVVKRKYPDKIQDLKLDYDDCGRIPHIDLLLIRIKKPYRCQGIGSMVLLEVLKFADEHKIEVWLYATNLFGSTLERLYAFYLKHGFAMTNKRYGRFKYKPKKVL